MMALAEAVVALLTAEAQLTALFTGGIVSLNQIGGLGLTKRSYPDAWEPPDRLVMRPTLMVRTFREQVTLDITDEDLQYRGTRSVVRLEYFDDRSHGWTTLYNAMPIVYRVLESKSAGGKRLMYQDYDDTIRVKDLDYACAIVETYFARGVRRPS
jgi:hypothetical protein